MFPIGHLHKAQVREIAETHGLATAKRPDSYGICFIGKRKLDTFLPGYIGVTKGAFVDHDTGEVLGTCVSREVGDGEPTQLRLRNGKHRPPPGCRAVHYWSKGANRWLGSQVRSGEGVWSSRAY